METTGMENLNPGRAAPIGSVLAFLAHSGKCSERRHQVSTAPPEGKGEPQQLSARSSEPALSFSLLLF